ncbi:sulfatase-like hydrolase/transferase [Maribellus comscasis]|uniref:Sulfatase-like hydrolase/transferase n=1 Tax=Maribellus comscasis TaxID=2681766 RepID=A0A6I6K5C8_9BACT|nr:sulfatase [Maribellus comscasis]QGY47927.1 sulfatase-like hydrolase/transferase [Maribellus comscasis]
MNFKILFLLFFVLSLNGFRSSKEKDNNPPNIVLIYLDDMGYGDLTLTGATDYSTPNLDKIASHGMFFSHYYSPQAVCSASRAGLLTGCYPNRIGITGALSHRSTTGISDDEETIAQVLKKKGYATAIFGKWHLGYQKQFLPTKHGFDEFYGIPYSHDMWPLHPTGTYPNLPLYENETIVNPDVKPEDVAHFTADFAQKTIDFIQRNQDKPFFVYWPNPLPHVPLYASERFKGKSKQGMYGDVMMEIDWGIGEIIKTLEATGLDKNTLVIFTSDNGPWLNYGNHAGTTGGLREGKGTSYEGGQRVPCLMMWKGVIPEGVVCNNLVSGIDILPTLAAIADAPLPKNKIDGVNLLPLLKGNFEANPRETFLYYYRKNSLEAVRHGSWKLVFPHPGRTYEGFQPGNDGSPGPLNNNFSFEGGLYDLRRDPGERYDVSESNPEIVKMLEKIAEEARLDLGDDLTGNHGENRREPGRVKQEN